jgi:hypothetical protein
MVPEVATVTKTSSDRIVIPGLRGDLPRRLPGGSDPLRSWPFDFLAIAGRFAPNARLLDHQYEGLPMVHPALS